MLKQFPKKCPHCGEPVIVTVDVDWRYWLSTKLKGATKPKKAHK